MKKYQYLVVAGLLLFCFGLKMASLFQTPFANGWDGYYYLMQLQSIMQDQQMQSPDFSLVYPYLLSFRLLIANDVLAYKVAVGSLTMMFAFTGFLLAYKTTGKFCLGLLAIALATFSPTLTFFSTQFVKNLQGIIVLLWFIYFFVKGNKKMVIIFLVLSFFTHRVVAAISIIVFIAYIIQSRFNWKIIAALAIFLIMASLLAPGIFHISDLQRFQGQLSWLPQLAPLSLASIWFKNPVDGWWIIEAFAIYGAYILLLIFLYKNKEPRILMVLATFTILIIPFYQLNVSGIGYRFFLTFLLSVLVFIPLLFTKIKKQIIYGLTAILLILSFFSIEIYQPKRHDPPQQLYLSLTGRLENKLKNTDASLIIAHKGLAEVIIYKSNLDALNWVPEYAIAESKVWRMVYVWPLAKKEQLDGFHYFRLSANYYLIQELEWQKLVRQAEIENAKDLLAMINHNLNPAAERPAYLRKGKNIYYQ